MTISEEQLAAIPDNEKAIMDVFDEDLIRQELGGALISDFVYEFEMGGKKIQGLTAYGWNQVARIAIRRGLDVSILMDKPITEERADHWKASVKVTLANRAGNRLEFWASKCQPKNITNREGKVIRADPNAEQIAETKAQRNGIAKAFPPRTATEFILQLVKEGKVKALGPEEVEDARMRLAGKSSLAAPEDVSKPDTELRPFIYTFADPIPAELAEDLKKELDKIMVQFPPMKYAIRPGKSPDELASVFVKDVPRDCVQLVKNNLAEAERKLIGGGE